ncbi:hypothetical protein C0993_002709 [Termitomyces sp. T159_Od127]|nr:hypothetical protein C0993_002709 [Termitomyces sp. T159_Od127]
MDEVKLVTDKHAGGPTVDEGAEVEVEMLPVNTEVSGVKLGEAQNEGSRGMQMGYKQPKVLLLTVGGDEVELPLKKVRWMGMGNLQGVAARGHYRFVNEVVGGTTVDQGVDRSGGGGEDGAEEKSLRELGGEVS